MPKRDLIRNAGLILLVFGFLITVYAFYASHAAPAPGVEIMPSTKLTISYLSYIGPSIIIVGFAILIILRIKK
jgi:hypothetical protein